jgi:predicted double-glycine peptidase
MSPARAIGRAASAACALALLAGAARAEDPPPPTGAPIPPPANDPSGNRGFSASVIALPGGAQADVPVQTYVQLRFKGIERQTKDLSCGAAALATLLKGYFGIPVTETTVIAGMLANASPQDARDIAQNGFSMLELKHYAESWGLTAGGFRANRAEELRKLRAPVIALINSRGYNHFVVIRRVRGDQVAIADPAYGNRVESLKAFGKRWDQVILVAVAPGRPVNVAFMEGFQVPTDPRAVQLFLTRSYAPALSYGPGDFY